MGEIFEQQLRLIACAVYSVAAESRPGLSSHNPVFLSKAGRPIAIQAGQDGQDLEDNSHSATSACSAFNSSTLVLQNYSESERCTTDGFHQWVKSLNSSFG